MLTDAGVNAERFTRNGDVPMAWETHCRKDRTALLQHGTFSSLHGYSTGSRNCQPLCAIFAGLYYTYKLCLRKLLKPRT